LESVFPHRQMETRRNHSAVIDRSRMSTNEPEGLISGSCRGVAATLRRIWTRCRGGIASPVLLVRTSAECDGQNRCRFNQQDPCWYGQPIACWYVNKMRRSSRSRSKAASKLERSVGGFLARSSSEEGCGGRVVATGVDRPSVARGIYRGPGLGQLGYGGNFGDIQRG